MSCNACGQIKNTLPLAAFLLLTLNYFQSSNILLQYECQIKYLLRFLFKKMLFIYFSRGKRREKERERAKHRCVVASHTPPTGDLAHNPGTCPDWESNQSHFGSQAGSQSTKPHQPGTK